MAPDIIERLKASAQHQLCLPLLPFTHARSESINADNLNFNFLQLGRRSGGRPQRAVYPMRLPVNTVQHTTLVGLEPTTFRSLVDCWSDALPVVSPTQNMKHGRSRLSLASGDDQDSTFFFQHISVLIQRHNSILLCQSFCDETRPDDDL